MIAAEQIFVFKGTDWDCPGIVACTVCGRSMKDGEPYATVRGRSMAVRVLRRLLGVPESRDFDQRYLVCLNCSQVGA